MNKPTMAHTTLIDDIALNKELQAITDLARKTKSKNPHMRGSLQWDAWEKGLKSPEYK